MTSCSLLTLAFFILAGAIVHPTIAQPRSNQTATELPGQWDLDSNLTDSPEQIAAAIRADFRPAGNQQPMSGGFDGGGGGFGRGRMGGRDRGTPTQGGGQKEQANREEQDRLDAVTALLRYPPTHLTIAKTDSTISLADKQNPPRTFDLSGKRGKQSFGEFMVDASARFEGPQLVLELDLDKGRTIVCRYSVLPATGLLLVRMSLARGPGELGPFEIKHVYERSAP
jgi:hypothetical protein